MPKNDFDEEDDVGTLRSGKRYKLEGKKRNADGECKIYLEGNYNTSLWSDLEDHSKWIKKPETPEKPKTPVVRYVTPPLSGLILRHKEGVPRRHLHHQIRLWREEK